MNKILNAAVGLDHLQQEPSRLRSESERLNTELETLVLDNYQVFVRHLSMSSLLRLEGTHLEEVTRQISGALEKLEQNCGDFRVKVDPFLGAHKRNRRTLKFQMELVELLEVPQLVDACSRNGFHEEAIELANFVNSLEKRNLLAYEVRADSARRGSSVVQAIVDEVHKTLQALRETLLQLLRENESVAQQLQTLATIRKLDLFLVDRQLSVDRFDASSAVHSMNEKQREILRYSLLRTAETKLQMEFLEARSQWMRMTAAVDATGPSSSRTPEAADMGPYGKTIEALELYRTAWFSITTQFNALFEDAQGVVPSISILSSWMSHQIDALLRLLRGQVLRIDEGVALKSVVEQTLLFARRMGQIGCDFSSVALPLFEQCMVQRCGRLFRAAADDFKYALLHEKLLIADEFGNIVSEQVIPLYSIEDDASFGADEASIAAPPQLLRFPPLGFLLNALLGPINYIRECPMRNIRAAVYVELGAAIKQALAALVETAASVETRGAKLIGATAGQEPLHVQFFHNASVLIRHALLCMELIFGDESVNNADTTTWSSEARVILGQLDELTVVA